MNALRKEQWFIRLKERLDQFDESEDHGERTWAANNRLREEQLAAELMEIPDQAPSTKKKSNKKMGEAAVVKEAKKE
jgi:hypothetical protein